MRFVFRMLVRRFMRLNITVKLMLLYVALILLPTFGMLAYFYQLNLQSLRQSYYENQENAVLSAKESLLVQINQISSAYYYYQQSATLAQILNGVYTDTSNTLFYYLRDINPLIKNTKVNPLIENVSIYSYNPCALNMQYGLASVEMLDRDPAFLQSFQGSTGLWEFFLADGEPFLRYYRKVYTNIYPYDNGILVFYVNAREFFENFQAQVPGAFYLQLSDGDWVSCSQGRFSPCQAPKEQAQDAFCLSFPDSFPTVEVLPAPLKTTSAQTAFFPMFAGLLAALFLLFYCLVHVSITGRLKAFTHHIQTSSAEDLKPFAATHWPDEVGIAVSSYNKLLERTNSLIHENLKAKIQKQDADYYALQAQIKPHFFYNILENIRMNAEASQDTVTADMLLMLGRHMRYNLNMSSHPLRLEEELYAARNYLQIHDIRMKGKIRYEILVSTEIDDVYCPRFLLQPLLENSILHGYSLDRPLCIQILVKDSESPAWPKAVRVEVLDNGNGIPPDRLLSLQKRLLDRATEEASHVGLLNVNGRLSSFLQRTEGCIRIESAPGKGTRLSFYLRRRKGNHEDFDR